MKPLYPLTVVLAKCAAAALGLAAAYSTASADPIPFPPDGYSFDFESDPFENGWNLDVDTTDAFGDPVIVTAWAWDFMPLSGAIEVNPGDYGEGVVRASNGGNDDLAFGGAAFPLDPTVADGGSHADLGFSGESWLQNLGIGDRVDTGDGVLVDAVDGISRLEFTDLPAHESLSISFKFAVGGSVDGGADNPAADGKFEVIIDGDTENPAFSMSPNSNGSSLNGFPGTTTLALSQNLAGVYVERWLDTSANGPENDGDRQEVGWTLDSAYDVSSAIEDIPHTADTLTIDFVHHMTSAFSDEHTAIDDVVVTLGGTPVVVGMWPEGVDFVEDDFDDGILKEWTLTEWTIPPVATPRTEMTGTGGASGEIRRTDDNNGLGDEAFGGATFPLEPIVPPENIADFDAGFTGSWLSSGGSSTRDGKATLHFFDLPEHSGIDLDFIITAFDSIDADDVIPDSEFGGNFQILVDDEAVYEARFASGGGLTDFGFGFAEDLFSGANTNEHYREAWNGDAEFGPIDDMDRSTLGWTLDSGYDYRSYFDGDGDHPIAHTADTLTVTFVHGLNSGTTDEGIAIDDFKLTLLDAIVVPPGPDSTFSITNVVYTRAVPPEPRTVSITWPSSPGQTFGIDRSFDGGQTWPELNDSVPAADPGTETSFLDRTLPDGENTALYRVRRLP